MNTLAKSIRKRPQPDQQETHSRFRIDVVWERLLSNDKQRREEILQGRVEKRVVTVTLEGIVLQQEAAILQKFFEGMLAVPTGNFNLEMSKVPAISQRGIDALLRLRNELKKKGHELIIQSLHPTVRLTLDELGLNKAFRRRDG